jgi:pheromone a factor receptor
MSRYFRLMALSATLALFTFPLMLFQTISDFMLVPLKPWMSWASMHQNFSQVKFIPHEVMVARPLQKFKLDINMWLNPGGAFIFFGFFGFSGEARQDYNRIFWRIVRPLGIKPPALTPHITSWYAYLAILHGRTPTLTNPLVKAQERPF